MCFKCYQLDQELVTVVYDLGGDKKEYFKNHKGYEKRRFIPKMLENKIFEDNGEYFINASDMEEEIL